MFSASKSGQYPGYLISRSVRLRSSASAYLTRTPASAGSRTTFTWSQWVKAGTLGTRRCFVVGNTNTNANYLEFDASDRLSFVGNDGTAVPWIKTTSQVFRDPSAWYHIVAVFDSTNVTAADRVRLYVNGTRITAFASSTDPTLNYNTFFNQAVQHDLGRLGTAGVYFDGYLTEINFIDGQALTPSSFGVTNAYGVWSPIKYNGTYGTNGFYLNFSDNSGATATTIGKDYSGNGNNWTPNNISVTAGVTYDSMLDVPTPWGDGGNGRGNYCVINPLAAGADATISNANLSVAYGTSATISTTLGTMGMSSGQWYWENTITATSVAAVTAYIGMVNQSNPTGAGAYPGATSRGWSYYGNLGNIYNNGGTIQTSVGTFAVNDVIGVAYDADAGTLRFFKNNTQVGTTITGIPSDTYYPAWSDGSTGNTFTIAANFGQRPFSYTPPSGFKALNTQNLPTPTIANGANYFAATTYTGNGTSISSTQNVTGLSYQPDLVWIKDRTNGINNSWSHYLVDSVRGINSNGSAYLASNETSAEVAANSGFGITALNNDGFSLKGNGTLTNTNGDAYVAWTWKEGATQGFDIVTYTGNGANRTIAHNLGVAPKMIILKARTGSATDWYVYHANANASPATGLLYLNLTNAFTSSATAWNNTAPTSSVFSLGTASGGNANTINYVAYLFAEVAGFSRFGSYTGNGSTNGPFVYTGFRPAFVMIKSSSSAGGNWLIQNNKTLGYNPSNSELYANLSNAETTADRTDLLSNGFKPRINSAENNSSGVTYIYAAFAESPFKFALAR